MPNKSFLDYINIKFSLCIMVPITFHLIFSKYGFNPTDDGHVLANSKRILFGEVPHKDFISVRPAGSAYLHAFEVLFFKDSLFYFSRLIVWLQFGIISYFSVEILSAFFKKNLIYYVAIYLGCFALTSHNFFITSWATIDGVMFIILGIFFIENKKNKILGYFLISIACMCKQSFILFPLFYLIITKDFKKIFLILSAFSTILVYLIYLYFNNALGYFDNQVISNGQSDRIFTITFSYLKNYNLMIGFIFSIIINQKTITSKVKEISLFVFFLLLIVSNIYSLEFEDISFFIFGYVGGYAINQIYKVKLLKFIKLDIDKKTRILFLALFLSWSSSISVGYPFPTLGISLCYCVFMYNLIDNFYEKKTIIINSMLSFTLIILLTSVFYARYYDTYREKDFSKLNYKLDNIFPGMKYIYTNQNTFLALEEMHQTIQNYKNFVLLPNYAGFWAAYDYKNNLISDWPQWTEVPGGKPLERLKKNLIEFSKKGGYIILSKYSTHDYKDGFIINQNIYNYAPITKFVEKNFKIENETNYFIVYKN